MNKDELLAQVDQVAGWATDEEILRFNPALKPRLARIENRLFQWFGENTPLTEEQISDFCKAVEQLISEVSQKASNEQTPRGSSKT